MYNRLILRLMYNFSLITKLSIPYNLVLGKNIQRLMFIRLISFTESIRKNLDERNLNCDVFVDL